MPAMDDPTTKEYLKQHALHDVFEELASRIIAERPADPKQALLKHLAELSFSASKSAGDSSSPVRTPAPPPQAADGQGGRSSSFSRSGNSRPSIVDFSKKHSRYDNGRANMTMYDKLFSSFAEAHPDYNKKFWTAFRELMAGFEDGYIPWDMPKLGESIDVDDKLREESIGPKCFTMAIALAALNPLELAELLDVDWRVVANELLNASGTGMFAMRWCIACSKCSAVISRCTELIELPEQVRCVICQAQTAGNRMQHLVAMFYPSESILYYPADSGKCNERPRTTKKTITYDACGPNDGEVIYHHQFKKGHYGYICAIAGFFMEFDVEKDYEEGSEESVIEVNLPEMMGADQKPPPCKTGNVVIIVRNRGEFFFGAAVIPNFNREEDLDLHAENAYPRYLSAMEVMHFPAFQKYFAKQVLSLQQSVTVEKVVLVFTDITDSTKQYDAIGDSNALKMVKDHFEILFDAVEKHKGRVVKTIGDAVMCSFTDPSAAVIATMEAISRCKRYSRSDVCPNGGCVKLKIGMHAGQAMLVALNGVNDYFGQTVNIAARVQGTATSNEIVIADSVYEDAGLQETMKAIQQEKGVVLLKEERSLTLKGVSETVGATSIKMENDGREYNEEKFSPEIYTKPNTNLSTYLPKMLSDIVRGKNPEAE